MKKTLSLVVALVLAFTCFASIGVAESANLSAPGELPIWTGAEPATLSVLIAPSDYVADHDKTFYTEYIEKNTGVNLEFVYLPAVDGADKLNIMVSTGETLPDAISYGLNVATAKAYGDAGALVNIAPYIDAGLAPNIEAAVAAFPTWNLISSLKSSDGTLYGVPRIQASPSNETKYKMWINEQWLKNLNLEVPTTTEEFYNMLVAFKEQDANGNGDPNDEIPFLTSTGFGGTAYKFLTNSFVYEGDDGSDRFMLDADGNVTVSYIQDGWFEAQNYMKKLHDEGLLASESFTYSNTDVLAVLSKGDVVGVTTNSSLAYIGSPGTENHDNIRLRYICIEPLTGPTGLSYTGYMASSTQQVWFVTADCENPELAFRVGDFQFTEEAFIAGRFGIENEHWMTAEDYTAANPGVTLAGRYEALGYAANYVWFNDVWDTENQKTVNWHLEHPYFSGNVEAEGAYVADDGKGKTISLENNATTRQETASGLYQLNHLPLEVYVPTLNFTPDELDELAESMSTIRTYVNEQRTKYILGDKSDLENPEQFIQNLKTSFQLDRILEVANAAYARQYK